jgi:predicted amidophosphoribosyltransferase
VLDALLALVVPPRCAVCRADGGRPGEILCAACRRALPWLPARRCERCGQPAPCRRCPARGAAFGAAWSAVAYEGVARDVVRALKLSAARPLAGAMAAQIAAGAPPALLRGTVVAVPSHPRRSRARGFDPAALLARDLARRAGLAHAPRLLRRSGGAARQAGAGRRERLQPGRLRIEARAAAPPAVVLVDDVHTTGATLQACALALRAAGARRVVAITWARTLDEEPR